MSVMSESIVLISCRYNIKTSQERIGLAHRRFRSNFRNVAQREVKLIKADELDILE